MKLDKQTKSEIVQEYKLAKNRPEQISILADLYATTTAEIRLILSAADAYEIEPVTLAKAAGRIIKDGLTFGGLRNYYKEFTGHDAKQAKKVFKDYAHQAWGETKYITDDNGENWDIQELVKAAIEVADTRAKNRERKPRQDLAPAPCAAAAPFTDEQAGMLIAGLISLLAEQEARRNQMNYEITQKQRKANELISAAEQQTAELLELDRQIGEGKMLLDRLEQEQKAKKNA